MPRFSASWIDFPQRKKLFRKIEGKRHLGVKIVAELLCYKERHKSTDGLGHSREILEDVHLKQSQSMCLLHFTPQAHSDEVPERSIV